MRNAAADKRGYDWQRTCDFSLLTRLSLTPFRSVYHFLPGRRGYTFHMLSLVKWRWRWHRRRTVRIEELVLVVTHSLWPIVRVRAQADSSRQSVVVQSQQQQF